MTEQFNLSDRVNQYGYNDDGTPDSDILEVDDVKEFIKKLKEEIDNLLVFENNKKIVANQIIDKLAGERLT